MYDIVFIANHLLFMLKDPAIVADLRGYLLHSANAIFGAKARQSCFL